MVALKGLIHIPEGETAKAGRHSHQLGADEGASVFGLLVHRASTEAVEMLQARKCLDPLVEPVLKEGLIKRPVKCANLGQDCIERWLTLTDRRLLVSLEQGAEVLEDINLLDVDLVAEFENDMFGNMADDEFSKSPTDLNSKKVALKKTMSRASGRGIIYEASSSLVEESAVFRIYRSKYNRNSYFHTVGQEERNEWISAISEAIARAKVRAQEESRKHGIDRCRAMLARVYNSSHFQTFVAMLLVANFIINISETEIRDMDMEKRKIFDIMDNCFTVFYVLELLLNLFVNWFWPFARNGWSWFDLLAVTSSVVGALISALSKDENDDLSIIRSIRIFKIIRIFARLKALQRIVVAISHTVYPLFNTSLYSKLMPAEFGTFSLAALTMFQSCTGDGWMTAVVRPLIQLGMEEGQTGFAIWTSAFFITYILMVNVVLMNVAVAVLLEGFLSSIAETDMEVKAMIGIREYAKISGSLDPLTASFSTFDSAEQLRQMIRKLFKYLDIEASNSLSFLEFKMGLETLSITPALSITEEDWDHFTGHGKYLDDAQALDAIRFEECMRQELRAYSQRIISHQMRQATVECKEDALDYLAQKMQMAEVYAISSQLSDLIRDLNKNGLPQSNSVPGRVSFSEDSEGLDKASESTSLFKRLGALESQMHDLQENIRYLVSRQRDIDDKAAAPAFNLKGPETFFSDRMQQAQNTTTGFTTAAASEAADGLPPGAHSRLPSKHELPHFQAYMFERESERARVKDKNAHQLSAFLAKLDSDAKRHMDLVLGDWEDQRQSLKDRFDYEDKRNGVLNQRERQREKETDREGGREVGGDKTSRKKDQT